MVTARTQRPSRRETLGLWMNGEFVGTWWIGSGSEDVLEYHADWRASPQGRPLSLSLPLTPGTTTHRGEVVRAYFDNLLPDSQDIRARAASRFRARSTDAFDLLAQIGRDCVGALQILPDGMTPENVGTVEATPPGRTRDRRHPARHRGNSRLREGLNKASFRRKPESRSSESYWKIWILAFAGMTL